MKKMNKKYLIYWVNIILLMLNTALLVFFCFTPDKTVYKNEDSTISNEFLREELNFTDEQYKLINELDKDVLRRHQTVLKLLCQRRYQMLNELAKPNPSTEELNKIATSVGHLHKALKTQTARHLLNTKKVCTPEQSKKLEKMFIDLLEINKHCSECAEKCTDQEKCKRCNKFHHYKNIESDSLETNRDSTKNITK